MNEKWSFNFRKRTPMEGNPLPAKEYEQWLLAKLDEESEDYQNARIRLMLFYRSSNRGADAMYHGLAVTWHLGCWDGRFD